MSATLISQLDQLVQNEQKDALSAFLKELLASDKEILAERVIAILEDEIIPGHKEALFHELILFLDALGEKRRFDTARLYYAYGVETYKGRYFLYAQDKIIEVENPGAAAYALWGNILTALGGYISEDYFFEEAIDKFAEACRFAGPSCQLLWDWAKAWKELSDRSGEMSDLKQAIAHFQKALSFTPSSAHFFIDFGATLQSLGELTGVPHYVEEAVEMYRVSLDREESGRGWVAYARGVVTLYKLTDAPIAFERANRVIEEAIAAAPEEAQLWTLWGGLFLRAGWNKRTLPELESAVEKLTSLKIQECSPLRVTALLSHALVALGIVLDDLKLMNEGQNRILHLLETLPDIEPVLYAAGCAHLAYGLYFQDGEAFEKSISYFKQGIASKSTEVDNWFGLFQAYSGRGVLEQDQGALREALKVIERVTKLRPFSPFYLLHLGSTLVALSKFEQNPEPLLEEAIVKFKRALALREDFEILFHYAQTLNLLAACTQDAHTYETAITILKSLFRKLPTDINIASELGAALTDFGQLTANIDDLKQAVSIFETLVERQKEDETILTQLGYTKLVLSELLNDPSTGEISHVLRRDAETKLLSAAHLGSGVASYHLASLYSLTNHLDLAMEHLLRAEESDALPPIEDIEHNPWFLNLSKSPLFVEFITARKGGGS